VPFRFPKKQIPRPERRGADKTKFCRVDSQIIGAIKTKIKEKQRKNLAVIKLLRRLRLAMKATRVRGETGAPNSRERNDDENLALS
jgi:hypothetical protein